MLFIIPLILMAIFLIWKKKTIYNGYSLLANESNKEVYLFFLVPIFLLITYFGYYIYINVWYVPNSPSSACAVFLAPRFLGGMNNLPSGIFTQWRELSIIFPLVLLLTNLLYYYGIIKNVKFIHFIFMTYLISLIIELSFTLLTHNGITHIAWQTISINNGMWYSMHKLSYLLHDKPFYEQLQYVYQVLCSNRAPYTIPGTTHPGGIFIIFGVIFAVSSFLSTLLMSVIGYLHMNYLLDSFFSDFAIRYIPLINSKSFWGVNSNATFYYFGIKSVLWGVLVTAINTMLIPVISLIMKELFTETKARIGTIFLIIVPSVALNFCAMADVLGSLFLGLGVLPLVKAIKLPVVPTKSSFHKLIVYGLFSGLAFTLAAQITFGHAFPILAFLIAFCFIMIIKKEDLKSLSYFLIFMSVAPLLYFTFEFILSHGQSFYISRGLFIASQVEDGLEIFRPFTFAYFANFLILFVMGGILFAPSITYILITVIMNLKSLIQKGKLMRVVLLQPAVHFVIYSSFIMLLLLLAQKAVRLETERVWHWFFVAIWALTPIFIEYADLAMRKLLSTGNDSLAGKHVGFGTLLMIQIFITLILSMGIQDYY